MTEQRVFFEVEYWYSAFSLTVQEEYKSSKNQFITKPLSFVQRRVNTDTRKLQSLSWGDGNRDGDTAIDQLTFYSKLELTDIGVKPEESTNDISDETKNAYPGIETLRSAVHRFWGVVYFTGEDNLEKLYGKTRCLVRAIFYPCNDQLGTTERCPEFKDKSFEQMVQLENNHYNGTFIHGIFRWQAWKLRVNMDDKGNPFDDFIGNGAGGGDRR